MKTRQAFNLNGNVTWLEEARGRARMWRGVAMFETGLIMLLLAGIVMLTR